MYFIKLKHLKVFNEDFFKNGRVKKLLKITRLFSWQHSAEINENSLRVVRRKAKNFAFIFALLWEKERRGEKIFQ